jgi:hypothetical protein
MQRSTFEAGYRKTLAKQGEIRWRIEVLQICSAGRNNSVSSCVVLSNRMIACVVTHLFQQNAPLYAACTSSAAKGFCIPQPRQAHNISFLRVNVVQFVRNYDFPVETL